MPVVDYGSRDVARRYASHRALGEDVLERWGVVVRRFITPPYAQPCRVLDVGAGTGIFARAWPRWVPCEVVALEPSVTMRAEMVAAGIPAGVRVIAGRGECLPLRAATVDVAWLSAVVHHLAELDACARELRRVIADDGVVLIRGLLADRGAPPGLRFLPGWQRALASFPSAATVDAAMSEAGFRMMERAEVPDHGPSTVGEAAAWVGRMRHADSMLGRLTDEEIAEGLTRMDARGPDQPLEPFALTLLAFGLR